MMRSMFGGLIGLLAISLFAVASPSFSIAAEAPGGAFTAPAAEPVAVDHVSRDVALRPADMTPIARVERLRQRDVVSSTTLCTTSPISKLTDGIVYAVFRLAPAGSCSPKPPS